MNIKGRIKKVETMILAEKVQTETFGIALDEWRRLQKGEDVLLQVPENRRPTFLKWQERAIARRCEAENSMLLFES